MAKQLTFRLPTYFSSGDEAMFFNWLQSLSCVESVEGQLRDLRVTLKRLPNDGELRELIALFQRYGLRMDVLAALETSKNRSWFSDPKMFWHKKVFGRR